MTCDDENPGLTRAAEAVSDGVPLDPGAVPAQGEEQQVLENLRAIETIARVHREAAAAAPDRRLRPMRWIRAASLSAARTPAPRAIDRPRARSRP
jgi:hypothetical protein